VTVSSDSRDTNPATSTESTATMNVASPPDGSAQGVSGSSRWHIESQFAYTNQLMERMQVRCNYLILANSVALVSFFTILSALVSNRDPKHTYLLPTSTVLVVALLPSAVFLLSLVVAVMAFLPRIYDNRIEINQDFIASLSVEEYRRLVFQKAEPAALTDFVDEIHVLSRILKDRTRRVDRAARLFIVAVVTMLPVIGLAAL
jgi:Family of unknown function (DUF5706)